MRLTRPLRITLALFAGLAFVAGIELFLLSSRTDDYFSWTIAPPLTAAFMGGLYWAACVLFVWASRQELWSRARIAVYPAFTIATVLLAVTLIHLDKFDLDSVYGWFWLVVYAIAPPIVAYLVWMQLREPGGEPAGGVPLPAAFRALVALQALVMLAIGVALLVAPSDAGDIWPWALTPLTARAEAALIAGVGLAAAIAARDDDARGFAGPAIAYVALGALELIALLRYDGQLDGDHLANTVYVGFLVTVLLAGLYGLLLSRSSAAVAASRS
ncbi:MAG: hypothetical protein ACXWW8_06460 [Solirubrobacterales bacterium]